MPPYAKQYSIVNVRQKLKQKIFLSPLCTRQTTPSKPEITYNNYHRNKYIDNTKHSKSNRKSLKLYRYNDTSMLP